MTRSCRFSLVWFLCLVLLAAGCSGMADTSLPPRPSPTIELQPTETARPSPTSDFCTNASAPGARTRLTFEEILPCMNSIERVSEFMANNMMYDGAYDNRERGENEYAPAWLVYERGVDDCDGHAILQCYFLESNGIDAVMLGINADLNDGHNVCAVNTGTAIYVLDDMGVVVGPFGSIEEAAQHYMTGEGALGTLLASQVTQITTDSTTPSVLTLPWNMIWRRP